eukprot:248615-Alexandrium_andersonii.AAC.1
MGASLQKAWRRSPGRSGKESGGNSSMRPALLSIALRRRVYKRRSTTAGKSCLAPSNANTWDMGMSNAVACRRWSS